MINNGSALARKKDCKRESVHDTSGTLLEYCTNVVSHVSITAITTTFYPFISRCRNFGDLTGQTECN